MSTNGVQKEHEVKGRFALLRIIVDRRSWPDGAVGLIVSRVVPPLESRTAALCLGGGPTKAAGARGNHRDWVKPPFLVAVPDQDDAMRIILHADRLDASVAVQLELPLAFDHELARYHLHQSNTVVEGRITVRFTHGHCEVG